MYDPYANLAAQLERRMEIAYSNGEIGLGNLLKETHGVVTKALDDRKENNRLRQALVYAELSLKSKVDGHVDQALEIIDKALVGEGEPS